MKQLVKLRMLVTKMTAKEVSQFKRYAAYKQKKKLLKLFELVEKNKEETSIDRLQIDIKRNNLHRNLRAFVHELYELVLGYWADNTSEMNQLMNVNKMINQAVILHKKGLPEESFKHLEKIIKVTEDTMNIEQTLLANRILYGRRSSYRPKNSPLQSENYLEYQLKTLKRAAQFAELTTLYSDGVYLSRKGLLMVEEEKVQRLLEIRKRGTEIIEYPDLPLRLYLQIGSLLGNLYQTLPPSNFQLAEKYHLNNLKRIEELDEPHNYPNYYGQLYIYMTFLSYNGRLEDLKKCQKTMIEANAKAKTVDVLNTGLIIITELMVCLLEYHKEKADEAINTANEYIKQHSHEVSVVIIWGILFSSFELAIIKGDLELAGQFEEQLNATKLYNKEMDRCKFISRIASLLLHYEKNNFEWVINQADSIKRLYSSHLKKNTGAKLLLKLLVQLSSTSSKQEKMSLFTKFSEELELLFEQFPEHRFMFIFEIIQDWVASKLTGHKTIFDYKNS